MRRFAFLTLFSIIAVCSHASFELLLTSDSIGNVIHRYDPINQVNLGQFGTGFLNFPISVAADQPNGFAYVLDSGGARVTRWDYNTGEFRGSFSISSGATYLNRNSDATLNIAYSNVVQRRNTSGALIQSYNVTSGFPASQGLLGTDGVFYVSTRVGNSGSVALQRFNYATGALTGSSSWVSDRMRNISGNRYFSVWTIGGGGSVVLATDTLTNGPAGEVSTATTQITVPTGVAVGHDGICYVSGSDAAGNFNLVRYDSNTNTAFSSFGTGLGRIGGIDIITAPEPGTFVALGLGAAAFLRKRRS